MFNFLKKKVFEVSPEYRLWRKLMFDYKPTEGLKGIPGELYGILMDVGVSRENDQYLVFSLYAFNTGETSLKASTGVGVTGLGEIGENSEHAKRIVQLGQSLVHFTSPIKKYDYPEPYMVNFYFMTTSGIRLYSCGISEVDEGYPFSEMFSLFAIIKQSADKLMEEQASQP